MIDDCGVVNLHLSDHCAVFCFLSAAVIGTYRKPCRHMLYRPLRHLNEFKLTNDLLNLPWSMLDTFDDIDDVVYNFNSMLLNVWDRHAPIKSRPMSSSTFG